jgi:predicted PurR-regulated permease PerM
MSEMTEIAPKGPHWSTKGLFVIAVGVIIVLARSFLMPLVLAFLLSLTFSPVRRWCERRRVPDGVSAAVIVIGLLAVCAAALGSLSGPLQNYAENAPTIMRDVEVKLRGISDLVDQVSEASDKVEELAGSGDQAAQLKVDTGPGLLTQAAITVPYVIAQLLLTLVMLFFLIASGDMFYEKIVAVNPTFRDKRRAIGIVYDIERKISRYFLTITTINAGLGLAVGLAFWFMGMPNPVLFGAMAFALNFIPFLGAIAGVLISFAIGIVTFDTVGAAIVPAIVYFSLTSIEAQFVTPFAVGRSLKLNPVAVFVAVAFWGWAWSAVGMFIAVPILIVVRAFSEKVEGLNGLGIFLSGRGDDITESSPTG